jgi:hypothetical protein
MRRALGLLLPVIVASVGCISSLPFTAKEDAGPPNGDKDRTLAYWNGLRGAMGERSKSDDLRALTNLVRKQAETIRGMSAEGVDPELVAAAHAVAKCQDKVIELAEVADFQMAALRASPTMAKQFAEANRDSSAAAARLAELRGRMSGRYGVAFAVLVPVR